MIIHLAVPLAVAAAASGGETRPETPSKLPISPATSTAPSTQTSDRPDSSKAQENVTVTYSAMEINKGDEIAWYADGDCTVWLVEILFLSFTYFPHINLNICMYSAWDSTVAKSKNLKTSFWTFAKILRVEGNTSGVVSSPLFERTQRSRFYDEYSARRNERLKRKKGETEDEKKTAYDLGVKVESSKRRDSKRVDELRKFVSSTPVMEDRRENPRYLLRSMTKENKKLPLPVTFEKSVAGSDRKSAVQRIRKS